MQEFVEVEKARLASDNAVLEAQASVHIPASIRPAQSLKIAERRICSEPLN
jgi:hypothetical protein